MGDFNAEMTNIHLEEFCASYNLKNLIKRPTCFKNLENPACIDHVLTNQPKSFHSSSVFETGLSDFHKLTLTVLKVCHAKHKPKIIQHRDFPNKRETCYRRSHQRCSIKKGVLRKFTKSTGKHLYHSLFFNKVAGLRPAILLKKRLWYRCFPVNFMNFLGTPFL